MNPEKCIYFVPGYFVPGGWCRLASSAAGSYEKCQKLCERAEFHDESKPLGYVLSYFAFVVQKEGEEFCIKVVAINHEKAEHRAMLAMQEISLAPYGAEARRITKKQAEELKALNLIPFENFAEHEPR